MANDSTRHKGATWKRFVAGFAIVAASTLAGVGTADAAGARAVPKPPPAGQTGTGVVTNGTVQVSSARSGIRW